MNKKKVGKKEKTLPHSFNITYLEKRSRGVCGGCLLLHAATHSARSRSGALTTTKINKITQALLLTRPRAEALTLTPTPTAFWVLKETPNPEPELQVVQVLRKKRVRHGFSTPLIILVSQSITVSLSIGPFSSRCFRLLLPCFHPNKVS